MIKEILNRLIVSATLLSTPVWADLSEFEKYEESQEVEQSLIKSLGAKFQILQNNSMHEGKRVRGTHAKGTCMDGELEVSGDIPVSLKVGLFASPHTYATRVRFANGSGRIQSDAAPDARAISLSLDLGNGTKQDFAMNNGPIFPIGSLSDFNFLLDVGFAKAKAIKEAIASGADETSAIEAGERAAKIFLAMNPTQIPGFMGTIQRGADLQNQKVDSYRNLKYWSGSAFKFGDQQVAKFALTPCAQNKVGEPNVTDPDFLQNDVKDAISVGSTVQCWDFQVQLLDATRMTKSGLIWDKQLPAWQWVEDVTLDWDKAGAQFHRVGRLNLTPGSIYDTVTCDDPNNAVNVMKNSLPAHRGLGRINRGRAVSEEASQRNRP